MTTPQGLSSVKDYPDSAFSVSDMNNSVNAKTQQVEKSVDNVENFEKEYNNIMYASPARDQHATSSRYGGFSGIVMNSPPPPPPKSPWHDMKITENEAASPSSPFAELNDTQVHFQSNLKAASTSKKASKIDWGSLQESLELQVCLIFFFLIF
jgi:hypothetical protein